MEEEFNKIEELKEIKRQLAKLQERMKEIEEERMFSRWRVKEGECYGSIVSGEELLETDIRQKSANKDFQLGNYFKSIEDTEEVTKYLKIRMQIESMAHTLNNGVQIDWNNVNQPKYCLEYNYPNNAITLSTSYCNQKAATYCLDQAIQQEAIDKIGTKDLIFYLTFNWSKIYF